MLMQFYFQVAISGTGALFTRWGINSCPSTNGTKLVYAGRAGGTQYDIQGGGFNVLCLPEDPDYLTDTAEYSSSGSSTVRGAEYEFNGQTQAPHSNPQDHNVPCAICFTSIKTSVLMFLLKHSALRHGPGSTMAT